MADLISVVMPTYNGEPFVAAALESIQLQDLADVELIVVDDGSSDKTLDVVRQFDNALPIRLIRAGRIGNWVAVTNFGLREARGEWACFLHQDDFWLPGRIARLREEIAEAKGALLLHNATFVGPSGERLGHWTCPLTQGDVPSRQFTERLLVQNFIAIPSPLFRRKVVIDSGGLDESLWFTADWDLWLRLGAIGPVRFVDEMLSAFRIHPSSQTMARTLGPNEWEEQLTQVFARHFAVWSKDQRGSRLVPRVARANIAVSAMLAAMSRGESVEMSPVLLKLFALGPAGWHRYFRDSRILERVGSRLKMRFQQKRKRTRIASVTWSKEAGAAGRLRS